jgi:hypothetical protein
MRGRAWAPDCGRGGADAVAMLRATSPDSLVLLHDQHGGRRRCCGLCRACADTDLNVSPHPRRGSATVILFDTTGQHALLTDLAHAILPKRPVAHARGTAALSIAGRGVWA